MNKISLIINTLNEEKYIASCINSAKYIADEIIVCDMYSEDETVNIASSLGARIVFHDKTGFVEPARFFAISQAKHEWVLVLDADEQLSEKLATKLKEVIINSSNDVFLIPILYNYFGKEIKYGGFFSSNFPRFFKKKIYIDTYTSKEEMVHGNFHNLFKVKNMNRLTNDYYIFHDAYPTFEKYLQKTLCNYSLIESKGRFINGEEVPFYKLILVPLKEFLKRYFYLQGFRDGKIGLIICYLKSQYTFYTLLNIWFLNTIKNENI